MPTLCRSHRRGPRPARLPRGGRAGVLVLLLALPAGSFAAAAPAKSTVPATPPPARPGTAAPAAQSLAGGSRIAAVVNGDVISDADIANRARLFAISTGLPLSPEVIERLRPQIVRQLIDERLRVQEAQKRKIVIPDAQIAAAIKEIETRNNMPPGSLRAKLAADGVSARTLIDQIRAQLAWSQMLREVVADRINISDADVAAQQSLAAQRVGQTEYHVAEIFIPVDDPANSADAQRFAETVISELHAGAAFPLVAAQFSQTQSALEGGELGWVQTNQLDPAVARIVTQMPVGAVSNPVRVPGGFSIVALQAKREIGNQLATVVTLRQAFMAFTAPLTDPQNPTEQQRQALAKARSIQGSVHSCDQMEAVAKANNAANRPIDPGEVRVEGVNPPAFRQLLETLPIGKATEPLISRDGIAVITVCSREQKNLGAITAADIQHRLVEERVDMLSRQTTRDLHRKATIDLRDHGV
ncbi:MAG: peptidyl-prolyl cis-trans isomerase SurA [Acetobacteraceae bacterium]|jgi:peptidyl-prolyl cis-trans isomerase SurA|nr:peptidyl-prolyl cis-trans isomerase SurA [Acetobacteraceae bacterium]